LKQCNVAISGVLVRQTYEWTEATGKNPLKLTGAGTDKEKYRTDYGGQLFLQKREAQMTFLPGAKIQKNRQGGFSII
jgi:hypothetical protein